MCGYVTNACFVRSLQQCAHTRHEKHQQNHFTTPEQGPDGAAFMNSAETTEGVEIFKPCIFLLFTANTCTYEKNIIIP